MSNLVNIQDLSTSQFFNTRGRTLGIKSDHLSPGAYIINCCIRFGKVTCTPCKYKCIITPADYLAYLIFLSCSGRRRCCTCQINSSVKSEHTMIKASDKTSSLKPASRNSRSIYIYKSIISRSNKPAKGKTSSI